MSRITLSWTLSAAGLAFACGPGTSDDFDAPQMLGGVEVSASQLNEGKRLYRLYCASCHGIEGDGAGPAGVGLDPPPREFRSGTFLYKSTPGDELPTHDDLRAVIRDGVPARGMPGWVGLRGEDLDALAHYLETFSPRWRAQPGS